MKAAVITKPLSIEMVDIEKPNISEGQMLIHNRIASICGSDMPHFLNERPMQYPLPPGVPGHECIGIVAETRCKEYKEGDEVLSIPDGSRGFAEYFVAYPSGTVRIPDMREKLVLAQPLGTVIHACRKLFLPLFTNNMLDKPLDFQSWDMTGRKVAIVGQGSIGLLFTAMMKLMNADAIIGIDPIDHRLEAASRVGATHVVNCSRSKSAEIVSGITNGSMVDLAIEAVGKDTTVNDCIALARRNGVVLAFGVPRKSVYDFMFPDFLGREIRLLGSLGPDVQLEFPLAVDLIATGRIDVSHIISHKLMLDDIQKGFEMATERKDGAIKILIEF